jgi:ABC-type sugar transport system ATPase subunit
MVYQQFINYPLLTGAGKAEGRENAGAPGGATADARAVSGSHAAQLSGGQQRTAIARALVKGADLVLLDEPLANLDYKLREDRAHSYNGDDAAVESSALKPISITWRQGGAYALLGPSGCGKTTLLNLIFGIVLPSRGKILALTSRRCRRGGATSRRCSSFR